MVFRAGATLCLPTEDTAESSRNLLKTEENYVSQKMYFIDTF